MKGTFVNVRKYKSVWCFITGEDGVDYFCHRDEFVDPKSWKYAWNTNTCEFVPEKAPYEKDHPRAFKIEPTPLRDPLRNERKYRHAKERADAQDRRDQRRRNHQETIAKNKARKDARLSEAEKHRVYTILIKLISEWELYRKDLIFEDLEQAKQCMADVKAKYPGVNFRLARAAKYDVYGDVVLRELDSKGRVGKVLQ